MSADAGLYRPPVSESAREPPPRYYHDSSTHLRPVISDARACSGRPNLHHQTGEHAGHKPTYRQMAMLGVYLNLDLHIMRHYLVHYAGAYRALGEFYHALPSQVHEEPRILPWAYDTCFEAFVLSMVEGSDFGHEFHSASFVQQIANDTDSDLCSIGSGQDSPSEVSKMRLDHSHSPGSKDPFSHIISSLGTSSRPVPKTRDGSSGSSSKSSSRKASTSGDGTRSHATHSRLMLILSKLSIHLWNAELSLDRGASAKAERLLHECDWMLRECDLRLHFLQLVLTEMGTARNDIGQSKEARQNRFKRGPRSVRNQSGEDKSRAEETGRKNRFNRGPGSLRNPADEDVLNIIGHRPDEDGVDLADEWRGALPWVCFEKGLDGVAA